MEEQPMQVSYVSTISDYTNLQHNVGRYLGAPSLWNFGGLQQGPPGQVQNPFQASLLPAQTPVPSPRPSDKEKFKMRLLRYTVVDPDPILADKDQSKTILSSGTVLLNGTDDRGFLMELASKLSNDLSEHNRVRKLIHYEDKDGKEKYLKDIKLSNLDVVIELLKTY